MKKSKSRRTDQFRVNMWVDKDVMQAIRELAFKDHMKYQTWLNIMLRKVFIEWPSKR
jgi:predicted DNA binding CopG/RHH family protein